uniref:FG-GAP repeat protein n=1 Tax=Bosea sp. NBC_00436 TaxID=2969620 RepID=A0A9E8CT18_9HYPH
MNRLSVCAVPIVAGLLFSSKPSFSLTQPEVKAAVVAVAKSSQAYRDCLRIGGGKLEQTTDAKDINGDGIDEIILTETGTTGASMCFGRVGQQMSILVSDGAGGWRTALSVPAAGLDFIKRADNSWPDIEIGGPGFCFPIWRMQEGTGSYDIWKRCENGRLVEVKPSSPVTGTQPASIGTQVPVEINKAKVDGPPYDHNGSIVIVDAAKGLIVYDRPKKSIAATVKPGTVLFRGQPWKDGDTDIVIKGTAYVFKKGCQAAAYEARGTYHPMHGISQFRLEGASPIRSKTSCDIIGHTAIGPNSKLVFDIAIE